MRYRGRKAWDLAALAVVASVLCSCSGGDQDGSDKPEGLDVCSEFLGSGKVESVQGEMGGGALRVLDSVSSAENLMSDMVRSAQSWKPGGGTAYSLSEHPCDLLVEAKGGNGVFRSSVNWSLLSLDDVRAEVDSGTGGAWRNVGEDVFVETKKREVGLSVIIPCKVRGTRQGQESEIPLEVGATVTNVPDFDKELLGEITSHLVQKLVGGLKCENDPNLPVLN